MLKEGRILLIKTNQVSKRRNEGKVSLWEKQERKVFLARKEKVLKNKKGKVLNPPKWIV